METPQAVPIPVKKTGGVLLVNTDPRLEEDIFADDFALECAARMATETYSECVRVAELSEAGEDIAAQRVAGFLKANMADPPPLSPRTRRLEPDPALWRELEESVLTYPDGRVVNIAYNPDGSRSSKVVSVPSKTPAGFERSSITLYPTTQLRLADGTQRSVSELVATPPR